MLDVGQGESIFIESPEGTNYLVDCGSSDVKNISKYRVEPFLKSKGIDELDFVFVTHGDSDHINGIKEMIRRKDVGIRINTLVFPTIEVWDEELENLAKEASGNGVQVKIMEAGTKIQDGELLIQCLAPKNKKGKEIGNETSLILILQYDRFDMLFTGDVEGVGEDELVEVLEKEKEWEVLQVAHHGSKNSTSQEFLKVLRPEYAIVSAGKNNSYGHPHEETLTRLKEYGCQVYTTKESGAIGIRTNGETVEFIMKIKYTFRR